jgi:hypothetical protein
MHAIHDTAASIDMTRLGRKYGNLKVDINSKCLSYAQDDTEINNVIKIV